MKGVSYHRNTNYVLLNIIETFVWEDTGSVSTNENQFW